MSKKRPTINQVAAVAGVSTATVSRALASPDVVSPETRKLVFDAVTQTGYRANPAARSLRQNRSNSILVVLPDVANPFFAEILSGIETVATLAGYTILIGNTEGREERCHFLLEGLLNGRADGALLLNGRFPKMFPLSSDLKIVSISESIEGFNFPHVGTDNTSASCDAVSALISRGNKNIAHIEGPLGNILSVERRAGYENAMHASGLSASIKFAPGDFTIDGGRDAIDVLLDSYPEMDAVFCANDETAIGVVSRLNELKIHVPDEISVMGFDDIKFAKYFSPSITTIHQARFDIGKIAMAKLLDLIEGKQPPERSTCVPHKLIERGSTRR